MMPDMARTKLYVVPASHPCATVERALQLKSIDYQRVDLVPGAHVLLQKLRFGKRTVPGVQFADGTRVSGSRDILRELERRVPEPSLGLDDTKVTFAEEWGDEVLQPIVRRLVWGALKRSQSSIPSYSEGAKLPVPDRIAGLKASTAPIAALESKLNGASDPNVRADLLNLHEHLDRIDRWVEEGTLGGEQPNAADLQIASSLRLLLTLGDLRPILEAHRAADLARKWFPEWPGDTPAGVLPQEWLPSATASAPSGAAAT
jgi:glutathione S-transferase